MPSRNQSVHLLILKPPLLTKLLNGSKTQHRVLRKPGQWECPMVSGKSYPVKQKPDGEALTRILVTHDRIDTLAGITPKDAQLEGFKRRDEALRWYENEWGIFHPDDEISVDETPCWVITFELDSEERGRYLTAQAGRLAAADYESTGLDELDAGQVPDAEFVKRQVKDAHAREEAERAAERRRLERMALEDRLARVRKLAREKGLKMQRRDQSVLRSIESYERAVEREG